MPNWCENSITLTHKDPSMIDRVIKGQEGLLMEFLPTPKDLIDTVSGFVGEDKQAEHEAQMARNIKQYGYKDWYDWNVANWGTKWDFSFDSVERIDNNTVSASFDSAWSPPTTAYEKLIDLGFYIKAYYYEPGMGFCGVWEGDSENGFFDDYCEYSGETSKTVRDVIGIELDEMFGISEQMADWEEENEEEENE